MIIAIKGLIGCGKTTTAQYLHDNYNTYHYNCDKRVKTIYQSHKEVIERVNTDILETESQVIDIKQLRDVVFSNPDKLAKLEAIIYPYLEAEIDMITEEYNHVLLDCQQIDKLDLEIDYNIALTLNQDILIERVKERDNRSEAEILEILEIQKKYQIVSDYTVDNSSSLEHLYNELDKVMEDINGKANR